MRGLELHKKLKGTFRWERVTLPENLPPVDLGSRPLTPASGSPPPGRPRLGSSRDKRERESSGSESEQHQPKVAKQVNQTSEVVEEETAAEKEKACENADLVSEGATSVSSPNGTGPKVNLDPGNFTSIQGTPSKSLSFGLVVESPVFSRSKSARQ